MRSRYVFPTVCCHVLPAAFSAHIATGLPSRRPRRWAYASRGAVPVGSQSRSLAASQNASLKSSYITRSPTTAAERSDSRRNS